MKRCPFTLVEMLVVLVITGILLALAIPAFERLTVGSGVDAGARMVGAQLRLTRQYAITTRTRIALLIPQIDETLPSTIARHHIMFRACQVGPKYWDGTQWVWPWRAWIPNTKWDVLPTGALLAGVGTAVSPVANTNWPSDPPTTDITPTLVTGVLNGTGVAGTGFSSGVRAVVFKANGKLDESAGRYVWLAEGFLSGSSAKLRNIKNVIAIYIDEYTGRISYPDLNPVTKQPL